MIRTFLLNLLVFILFITYCSSQKSIKKEIPSPIPMGINYSWKYYNRSTINGSLWMSHTKTIIDTVTYNSNKYYKVKCVDTQIDFTTIEYWRWEEPIFKIYNRNLADNTLFLDFEYSTILNDTIDIDGRKCVLVDTLSTFENFRNCWKYEIIGISNSLIKYRLNNKIKIKDSGPVYLYIKPNVGFLNDEYGRFLDNYYQGNKIVDIVNS